MSTNKKNEQEEVKDLIEETQEEVSEQEKVKDQVGETAEETQEEASEQEVVEEDPVVVAEKKLAAINDKYLRLYSEFDNFRRRTAKEKLDLMKSAGQDIVLSLLPVLDDIDRALQSFETAEDIASVKEGVQLIQNKLKGNLENKGLKSMDSKGEVFDVDKHEALTNIPAPSKDLKGKVVDVIEKGYTLNDKVIRFAKVVVGN